MAILSTGTDLFRETDKVDETFTLETRLNVTTGWVKWEYRQKGTWFRRRRDTEGLLPRYVEVYVIFERFVNMLKVTGIEEWREIKEVAKCLTTPIVET